MIMLDEAWWGCFETIRDFKQGLDYNGHFPSENWESVFFEMYNRKK